MPKGGEEVARMFYNGCLGLRELPKPHELQGRCGVWSDAGGLGLHLSVEEDRPGIDRQRHFGLGCGDDGLKVRLRAAGVVIEDSRALPMEKIFYLRSVWNRIEIHQPRGLPRLRASQSGG